MAASAFSMLIVADPSAASEAYREAAEEQFQVKLLARPERAGQAAEQERADVVLLDAAIPEPEALELLSEVKLRRPAAEVIWVTANATVNGAGEAMRRGAFDVVPKPFSLDELRSTVQRVATQVRSTRETRLLEQSLRSKQGFGSLVGNSPEMERLY